VELVQLAVPGRHARWSDFFVDAVCGLYRNCDRVDRPSGRQRISSSSAEQYGKFQIDFVGRSGRS
jgi:hypothetical protein